MPCPCIQSLSLLSILVQGEMEVHAPSLRPFCFVPFGLLMVQQDLVLLLGFFLRDQKRFGSLNFPRRLNPPLISVDRDMCPSQPDLMNPTTISMSCFSTVPVASSHGFSCHMRMKITKLSMYLKRDLVMVMLYTCMCIVHCTSHICAYMRRSLYDLFPHGPSIANASLTYIYTEYAYMQ